MVSGPISLKPEKSRSTIQKTVGESVKGKYLKNQLEPYGLKHNTVLTIFLFDFISLRQSYSIILNASF